jgi:hypothetical protein
MVLTAEVGGAEQDVRRTGFREIGFRPGLILFFDCTHTKSKSYTRENLPRKFAKNYV